MKAFEGMVKEIENEILKSYSVGSTKDQEEHESEYANHALNSVVYRN